MDTELRRFRNKVGELSLHRLGPDAWHRLYLERCREAFAIGPKAVQAVFDRLDRLVTSDRVFPLAARAVQRSSGGTLGPDDSDAIKGLKPKALRDRFRDLPPQLCCEMYQPGRTRTVSIPKFPTGQRTIHIANFDDRVAAKSSQMLLDPLIDPTLIDNCFGFRQGRSRFHALARLEQYLAQGYRFAIVIDIKNAFGSLPHRQLRETLVNRIRNQDFTDLIELMLGMTAGTGIPQGNALSPLALNLYCDQQIDRPWRRKNPAMPMIRYADDILVLAHTRPEAEDALFRLRRLVCSAALSVKDDSDNPVIDLGETTGVNWLGSSVRMIGNELVVTFRPDEAQRLAFKLRAAQAMNAAEFDLAKRLRQWVHQRGVAFGYVQHGHLIRIINTAASSIGMSASDLGSDLMRQWQRGHKQWLRTRRIVAPELVNFF